MRLFFSLCGALPLLTGSAYGWGCTAHPLVALIARAHLTPAVSKAVDKLLTENPLNPAEKRYCQEHSTDLMADTASWADDRKSIDKTFTWHFVDIPLVVSRADVASTSVMDWCEEIGPPAANKDRPGCITTAIAWEWSILSDVKQLAPDRAAALRYIVHLMGDLSQPMHDEDNHDQGGNCTQIKFFGAEKLENLHTIWDDRLVTRDLANRRLTPARYAVELDRKFAKADPAWVEKTLGVTRSAAGGTTPGFIPDLDAWAWEGHELARTVTYGKLTPPIPMAPADAGQTDRAGCALERTSVAGLHIAIDDRYFNETIPVIRIQLAKAGYRLAALLNQGF